MNTEPATITPSRRLLRSSGFIFGGQVWFVLLSFATMPYIVRTMGVDGYGVFSLLVVFAGYLSHLDLGLGWALTKFVAEYEARGETDVLERSVRTAVLALLAGGALGALLLIGLSDVIVTRFLSLPPALAAQAKTALWVSAGGFAINSALGALSAVLRGFHRFDITTGLNMLFGTLATLGTVAVLAGGGSLVGVVSVHALVTCGSLAAHVVVLRRLRPDVSLLPRLYRPEFSRMFSFSVFTLLGKVGVAALFQIDKVIVASFLPVAYVSYYVIPFGVAQKLNLLGSIAATVMFPLASEEFAGESRERYEKVYRRTVKVVFLVTGISTVVVVAFSDRLLRVWLGADFAEHGGMVLALLSVAFCVNALSSVEAVSIEGAGRPRVTAGFLAVSAVINLTACPILTRWYGITGTAIALTISLTTLSIMNIVFFNRALIRSTLADALTKNYLAGAAAVVLVIPVAYLLARAPADDLASVLLMMAASGPGLCGIGLWVVLNTEERQMLKSFATRWWR